MNPREFLDCAKSLIDPPTGKTAPSASDCRSAISRSYYAAFNVAKALLDELNIPLDKAKDSHAEVMDLVASGEDDLTVACTSLASQKTARKRADYDMNYLSAESTVKAGQTYLICLDIVSRIDAVRNDTVRWQNASNKILARAKTLRKI